MNDTFVKKEKSNLHEPMGKKVDSDSSNYVTSGKELKENGLDLQRTNQRDLRKGLSQDMGIQQQPIKQTFSHLTQNTTGGQITRHGMQHCGSATTKVFMA